MPEQSTSDSEYKNVLTKILTIAQENSYLWDSSLIPGALPLVSYCIDEQDNSFGYYGITKGKQGNMVFCYSSGKTNNPLREGEKGSGASIQGMTEILQRYQVPIEEIKSHFLEEIEGPLMGYLEAKAKIKPKAKKILRSLELGLSQ